MSVVIGIKHQGKVYLGADSQMSQGGLKLTHLNPNNYKIWKVLGKSGAYLGTAGDVRDACIIRTMEGLIGDNAQITYPYVVRHVVPKIIDELKKFNYIRNKDGYFDNMESTYLLATKDSLFQICTDGCVVEIEDGAAIGSGRETALGSLNTTFDEEPYARLIKGLKSAENNTVYVGYPFVLADVSKRKFEIVDENSVGEFLGKE